MEWKLCCDFSPLNHLITYLDFTPRDLGTRLYCPFYLPRRIYAGRAILFFYTTFCWGPCAHLGFEFLLTLNFIYFFLVLLLLSFIHAFRSYFIFWFCPFIRSHLLLLVSLFTQTSFSHDLMYFSEPQVSRFTSCLDSFKCLRVSEVDLIGKIWEKNVFLWGGEEEIDI